MTDAISTPASGQPWVVEENLPNPEAQTPLATLTLLAEQPQIEKIRTIEGQVTIRREIRTQTVQIPVEIQQEVLVIQTRPVTTTMTPTQPLSAGMGSSALPLSAVTQIELDGQLLGPDQTIEIELSHEVPQVIKQVVTAQEVKLYRRSVTHTETHTLELGHEVLDVHARATVETPIPTAAPPELSVASGRV